MTKEELEELLDTLEQVGFNVVDITADEFNENNKDEDYECFDEYIRELKMKKKFEISKIDFNKACDYVIGCLEDVSFEDIMLLARFTSAVRYVLFDVLNREQKKEEK